MAEIAKGIIDIEINTGAAAAQLKSLQAQINAFNLSLSKQNKNQALFAADYAKELQLAVSKTGMFTSEMVKLSTAASTLDKTLSKGRSSLGQFFSAKFNKDSAAAAEVMGLAAERASRMQTQFIATSAAAKGMQEAIAIRPLAAFSSEMAISAQRAEIMSAMFKQGTTQLINFGKNVQWAGRQLMVGFTVPLTIFGNTAGKVFMDLEKQVVGFKKVYGDLFTTPAELNKNIEAVQNLAEEYTKYGIAAKDTIGLAAQAAAAGRKNADLTDAVAQATRLATLGQMDQNSALETTISLQSAFKLSGQELADSINFLNMVENQTIVSLQDLSAAIPRVAPVIVGLGGDVKDLAVFLAAMQEGGVDAAEGANALKSGLASLINPTKQATQMLAGMGINLQAIIDANKGDLMATVMAFSQALGSLDQFSRQQALEQVFGKFQYAKLGALFDNISRQGSQAQQVIATMGYSTEQLGATADKELKTIEQSFGVQLVAAVERLKLAIAPIGELFVKLAIPVVNFLTDIITKFNELSEGKKQFIAIATVLGGLVIPTITMLSGLLLNFLGTFLKMGQAVTGFSKALVTGGPLAAIKSLTQGSKYLSLAEIDAAMAAQQFAGASQAVNVALLEQAAAAGATDVALNKLVATYQKVIGAQTAVSGVSTFAIGGNAAKGIRTGGTGFRIRRNSGGTIPGSGNTDTVPAMLTPGEFVVNKEATKENLSLLKLINGGNVQAKSMGGIIQTLNRGAVVRQVRELIGMVSRKYMSYDDILKGSYSDSVKKLLSRWLSVSAAPKVSQMVRGIGAVTSKNNFVYSLKSTDNQLLRAGGVDGSAFISRLLSEESLRPISAFALRAGVKFNKKEYAAAIRRRHDELVKKYGKEIKYVDNLENEKTIAAMKNNPDIQFVALRDLHTKDVLNTLDPSHRAQLLSTGSNKTVLEIKKPSAKTEEGKRYVKKIYKKGEKLPEAGDDVKFTDSKGYHVGPTRKLEIGDKVAYGDSGKVFEWDGTSWKDTGKVLRALESDKVREYATVTEKYFGKSKGRQYSHIVGLARGGMVPGTGNTDTVPAMLTPGEFVINKKATNENRELLTAINNSSMQKFALGGIVGAIAGTAGGIGGSMAAGKLMDYAGIESTLLRTVADFVGFGVGMKASSVALSKFSKQATVASESMPKIAEGATKTSSAISKLIPGFSKAVPILSKFAGPVGLLVTAGLAVKGFNESINKVEQSAAELSKAMYGSAERTKEIGDALGRESYASMARRASVEAAAQREISPEAQQVSSEFIKTDVGQKMLKEAQDLQAAGEDAAIAMRNQLASAIIAGVLTPEEAASVANELGTALSDQGISVRITGELTKLIGKDGKDLLTNLSSINAQISSPITSSGMLSAAQAEIDKKNPFMRLFASVDDTAMNNLNEVARDSLEKEAQARGLLTYSLQEGLITTEEYNKQLSELNSQSEETSRSIANTRAELMGFSSAQEMTQAASRYAERERAVNTNIDPVTGLPLTQQQRSMLITEGSQDITGKNAIEAMKINKDDYKQMLIDSGMDQAQADVIIEGINSAFESEDVAYSGELFGRMIAGEISLQGGQAIKNMLQSGDITGSEVGAIVDKISKIERIPSITKRIAIETIGQDELNSLYDIANQIENFPSPITKEVLFKTLGFDLTAEQVNQFLQLDEVTQKDLVYNFKITMTETTIKNAEQYTGGNLDVYNKARLQADKKANDAAKKSFEDSIGKAFEDFTSGENGPIGGSGSGTDWKKNLQNRFDLVDKRLSVEAQKYQDVIRLNERQNELDQRNIAINQRALEQLSKEEDAINKRYSDRISLLDGVSQSNDRLREQESSRIDLAKALAEGNVSTAAQIMSQMTANEANYRIEDTRAALENQKEEDLKNLRVEVNGQLLTREQIQSNIDAIEEQIYQRNILIQDQQDQIYALEQQRLQNSREREKVETKLFLLEQRKAILELQRKKIFNSLTTEERNNLAQFKEGYNQMVATFNATYGENVQTVMFGGKIKRMAYGGAIYKGSNEPPPALKMAFGSMVPGKGNIDRVPALLTPGEFVVRKSAAQSFMPLLQMINDGAFPSLSSPSYSVPNSTVGATASSVTNSSVMYNDTYNINVNVSGTNASPDDIANVVAAKLSQTNRGNVRSIRY